MGSQVDRYLQGELMVHHPLEEDPPHAPGAPLRLAVVLVSALPRLDAAHSQMVESKRERRGAAARELWTQLAFWHHNHHLVKSSKFSGLSSAHPWQSLTSKVLLHSDIHTESKDM